MHQYIRQQRVTPHLVPKQLGVGVPRGCEDATHTARKFLNNMDTGSIMVKLDISNSFNSLHRDSMLSSVDEIIPELVAYCHLAYAEGHLFSSENSQYYLTATLGTSTLLDTADFFRQIVQL